MATAMHAPWMPIRKSEMPDEWIVRLREGHSPVFKDKVARRLGLTTQEIASLRNTSEGTVKAQTNAIYRKADVGGRPQLLSIFIDELMNTND